VTLMDALDVNRALPAGRPWVAYAAAGLFVAQSVAIAVRRRDVPLGPLVSALLVLGLAQAVTNQPAIVPLVMAAAVSGSMYESPRAAAVRTLVLALVMPVLVLLGPHLGDSPPAGGLAVVLVPTVVVVLLSFVVHTVVEALRQQHEGRLRESLLARASRTLLEVTSPDEAVAVLRQAAAELSGTNPGLQLEVGPGRFAAVGGPLGDELRDVVETLAAQLRLVEESCAARDELFRRAHYDELTAIANRALFLSRLAEAVDAAGRASPPAPGRVALLMIDLDDFKHINDSLGHEAGDALLAEVARRMAAVVEPYGLAARFGGDEFAVLLPDVPDVPGVPESGEAEVDRLAGLLRDAIIEPVQWSFATLQVGASIGVVNGAPGADAAELLRCADAAMYSAKAIGKNCVVRFRSHDQGSVEQPVEQREHPDSLLSRS
jgi:diguanylate cyclase (GGDEF)-like protein